MTQFADRVMGCYTKADTGRLADYIDHNPGQLETLLRLFASGNARMSQRASWPLSLVFQRRPELAAKHLPLLIDLLEAPPHPAVTRNVVRILQFISIPPAYAGRVMTRCFDLVMNPEAAVAPRAFSLTVLANLAAAYPEIIPEIKLSIESQRPGASPGFLARARHVLVKLEKYEK